MGELFFIADTHLGHKNALSFDNRPFIDIESHDQTIIENWNNAVGIDDEVWILGDFSWHNATKTNEILRKLNGIKHLTIGNHDKKLLRNVEFRSFFHFIEKSHDLQIPNPKGEGKELLVLSHFPSPCFDRHYYGAYHFYGHVHTSFEWNMMENIRRQMEDLYRKPCNMINIGCMLPYMNYTPRTFDEIIAGYEKYRIETISKEREKID